MDDLKRDKMFKDNVKLIEWCINRHFQRYKAELHDDLFQEGSIGLLHAIDVWDPSKGAFSTIAISCIYNSIRGYLRDYHPMRTPRMYYYLNGEINRLLEDGMNQDEILRTLGIDAHRYQQALNIHSIISLNEPINDEGDSVADLVADERGDPELLITVILDMVNSIIKTVPKIDGNIYLEVIGARIYLPPEEQPTQTYLANKYGVSQPKISRVIRKLDKLLKEKYYE